VGLNGEWEQPLGRGAQLTAGRNVGPGAARVSAANGKPMKSSRLKSELLLRTKGLSGSSGRGGPRLEVSGAEWLGVVHGAAQP
jgi:hypothetical protein